MYYIIDRFENGIAVLESENGTFQEFDAKEIPENAKEGQKLLFENGVFTTVANDNAENRIKSKMDILFGK